MIKITKHLYIHFLTPILFIICFFEGLGKTFFNCYSIMVLHELAHLFASLFIGLMPKEIRVYPFGLNLVLKNKMVYSLTDEIILYLAGPLMNSALALLGLLFKKPDFYMQNLALFLLNLLPIASLDGGVIFKKIMARCFNSCVAQKISNAISSVLVASLVAMSIYLAIINRFNFSLCFFIIFLLLNIFTADEKYNIDFLSELMFYKEKRENLDFKKIKPIIARDNTDLKSIAEHLSLGSYYVVFMVNEQDKITKIITESEIVKNLLEN